MTKGERDELYRTRIDETFVPYTVVDVIQKVFHRDFGSDLADYLGKYIEYINEKTKGREYAASRAWVRKCRLVRPEARFIQPVSEYYVDIIIDAGFSMEFVKKINPEDKRVTNFDKEIALRYKFDFRPCTMTCVPDSIIFSEERMQRSLYKGDIFADKYLLPLLFTPADYEYMVKAVRYIYDLYDEEECAPEYWIEEMGLKIKEGAFAENSVLGEYFFMFGTADIMVDGKAVNAEIDPGTIIINRNGCRSKGMYNSTLAHEGAHHFLGRYYFMLQSMHGHDYCSYLCKRSDAGTGAKGTNSNISQWAGRKQSGWSPVEIMELQANSFPRFLMIPEKAGKKEAERLIAYYGGIKNLETMRKVVDGMAERFGTTKTMARSRLKDFGYNEARGFMRSVDGNLVPSYMSELSDLETYTISEKDAVKEYARNPEFKSLIDSGRYIYVEGHYCLKEIKYYRMDQFGFRHLTGYAREHMSECCLVFTYEHTRDARLFRNGFMNKSGAGGCRTLVYKNADGSSPVTAEGKILLRQIEKARTESHELSLPFNEMLVSLMAKRKVTIAPLAEDCGLSRDTIKNMRNDPERAFSIREVVAVCIALHLSPEISEMMIEKSPAKFIDTTEMRLYEYAMRMWYDQPVAVVNRRLVEAGVNPLTKNVDGYDENGIKMA